MRVADTDLHLLRVFAAVARCGGFASAQAELNVSVSTISRQISDLERRLGVKVCRRGRAGFELTEEGKQVLVANKRVVEALDEFGAIVEALRRLPGGELKLGTTGNIVYHPDGRVAEAVGRFRARLPGVHPVIHINMPLELERGLAEGDIEIGIGPFPERVHRALESRPLFVERQYLYCGRTHEFYARADAAIADTDIHAAPFASRGYITAAADPLKSRFNIAGTAYTDEGIAQLILSGAFVGFLPEHYAAPWIERTLIRTVCADRFSYRVPYSVAYRKGGLTRAGQIFLEVLVAAHAGSG
jgi:LysR family transcriptional regulator, transcriptional activator for bauABCD operon